MNAVYHYHRIKTQDFILCVFAASQAFPVETDFAAVKIAIFAGSVLSAIIGVAILWNARSDADSPQHTGNK